MGYFPVEFFSFVSPNSDRFTCLKNYLDIYALPYSEIILENERHIMINFSQSAYDPAFKIKTVLAHYDSVPDSAGANDNAAAVYQLLCLAERLLKSNLQHNMRIIFTDNEEAVSKKNTEHSSFSLAKRFKNLGITNDDVFVFDCCGRGNVPVLSTAGKNLGSLLFRKRFDDLYSRTARLMQKVSPQKWVSLPVPLGDNAGFILSGIPAVLISVLPNDEATELMRALMRNKNLSKSILNRETAEEDLPHTWRMIHSELDTEQNLTQEAFVLMERFLDALSQNRTIV